MKKALIIVILGLSTPYSTHAQGRFLFFNFTAPTRIGTINGPFAGPAIYASMLAGPSPETLVPVGPTQRHFDGFAGGILPLMVAGIPCDDYGYVQMVAWDSARWGTSLSAVPPDQLGRTEILRHVFTCNPLPAFAPEFTQPAVVPVPEPAVMVLCLLGGGVVFLTRRAQPS